jgi:Tol biopolymer transport system component
LLCHVHTKQGVSNLWGQPVDGSPAKQLTAFKTDRIFRFAWSPDGKTLVCERGFYVDDVVLMSDFLM